MSESDGIFDQNAPTHVKGAPQRDTPAWKPIFGTSPASQTKENGLETFRVITKRHGASYNAVDHLLLNMPTG